MSKRKRTPEQFKAAKQFAVEATGYTASSVIWGKRLPEVLTMIEETVRRAISDINNGAADVARGELEDLTIVYIDELKKRVAKQAIITSQMK